VTVSTIPGRRCRPVVGSSFAAQAASAETVSERESADVQMLVRIVAVLV
jgi:hypothetical protein